MTSRSTLGVRRRLALAVAGGAVSLALVLTGCTGGASPGPSGLGTASASESAMPTPSATPTPTASYKPADANGRAQNVPVPVLPEAAKAKSKEGLEAFARHWYDTLSYAYQTGDVTPMQSISSATCLSCANVKEEVHLWNGEGRWMTGGKMVVQAAESKFIETASSEFQVLVQVYQETIDFYLPDGTMKGSLPRKVAIGDIMIATHSGSEWQANRVEHLANQ